MIRHLKWTAVWLASTTLFSASTTFAAEAEEAKPSTAVLVHGGQTSFSGDLSKNSTGSTWGFDVAINPHDKKVEDNAVGGIAGLWIIDFANTSTTAKDNTPLPFAGGKSVTIFESSLVPTVCLMATLPVQGCLGVGWTELNVVGDKYEQNYGTYRGDVRVGRYLNKGLVGGLEGHYYSLRQEIDGHRSGFSALSYEAAIGWQW